MAKHNKKRNVGILFFQLLKEMARCVVEDDQKRQQKIQKVLDKHLNPNTSLYREFRLFNSLVKTTVSSEQTAHRILEEAKKIARSIKLSDIQKERSSLIKDINYTLSKKIYQVPVPQYKEFATIQTLINDWRTPTKHRDLTRTIEFEEKVKNYLLQEKRQQKIEKTKDINNLTVKIMSDKFNKKYKFLTKEQKDILKNWILVGESKEDKNVFKKYLDSEQAKIVMELKKYKITCKNVTLLEKIDAVVEKAQKLNCYFKEGKGDYVVSKFLTLCQLKKEILEG